LVPDEDSKLLEVAGFPVAKVTFLNRHTSGNPPAKFCLVKEPAVDVKETLLNSASTMYPYEGLLACNKLSYRYNPLTARASQSVQALPAGAVRDLAIGEAAMAARLF
jgi:hypothetical protein